jgi:hypothetical protein
MRAPGPAAEVLRPVGAKRGDVELLGVPLVDAAEATELAVLVVPVAVGEAGHEPRPADAVVGLDALDDVEDRRLEIFHALNLQDHTLYRSVIKEGDPA